MDRWETFECIRHRDRIQVYKIVVLRLLHMLEPLRYSLWHVQFGDGIQTIVKHAELAFWFALLLFHVCNEVTNVEAMIVFNLFVMILRMCELTMQCCDA